MGPMDAPPRRVIPVVMLDNARIHHAAWPQLEAWCDAMGAKLVPLPLEL